MAEKPKRTPTFPIGLSDEMRAEWQKDADREGLSLAEYIRRCVEMVRRMKLVLDAETALPVGALSEQGVVVHQVRENDLARAFKGPDLRSGKFGGEPKEKPTRRQR